MDEGIESPYDHVLNGPGEELKGGSAPLDLTPQYINFPRTVPPNDPPQRSIGLILKKSNATGLVIGRQE